MNTLAGKTKVALISHIGTSPVVGKIKKIFINEEQGLK